ncbi:MAG: hypothetical protein HOM44_06885 [Gammaproteobacteria bacterium]|nr:hypothetical protein [Gammaproteobacteria bacterium]
MRLHTRSFFVITKELLYRAIRVRVACSTLNAGELTCISKLRLLSIPFHQSAKSATGSWRSTIWMSLFEPGWLNRLTNLILAVFLLTLSPPLSTMGMQTHERIFLLPRAVSGLEWTLARLTSLFD